MAVVDFELKDFASRGYSAEALKKVLPEIGIEVEGVADGGISINVTPNRPDLLDFIGVLRALDNFTGKKKPREGFYNIKKEAMLSINVDKSVKEIRPFIAGMVAMKVDLSGNMLKYLINFTEKFADTYGRKRKKIAIGLHNLDQIRGDILYSASKTGSFAPLGGKGKMSFEEILKKHEKGIAYSNAVPGHGTEGAIYPFISDSEKILAMIPITNSEATKVTQGTTGIFVDVTGTSQGAVRSAAALIASSFIYAGAEVHPVSVRAEKGADTTPKLTYREIKVSMKKAEGTIGVETGRHNVIGLANKMGYPASKLGSSVLFYVPPYRVDVLNEQDVIEDMAIAYGYDRITPLPVLGYANGLEDLLAEYENRIALLMLGLGYTEAINSSLTNEKLNFDDLLHARGDKEYVSIADAKTINVSMLRTQLLSGLLQNLSISANERLPHRLFEIGRTYSVRHGQVEEHVRLCVVSEHAKTNFAEIKAIVDEISGRIGSGKLTIKEHDDPAFIAGRCGEIDQDGRAIGSFGEVHPVVLRSFGIEEPVVALEIELPNGSNADAEG